MKVNRDVLLASVRKARKACDNSGIAFGASRSDYCLKVEIQDDILSLTGSSSGAMIVADVPGERESDETLESRIVEAERFAAMINILKTDDVYVRLKKEKVEVSDGTMKASIPSWRGAYPKIDWNLEKYKLVPIEHLRDQANQCSHALMRDVGQMLMRSFGISIYKDGSRVIALDGKRIAIRGNGSGEAEKKFAAEGKTLTTLLGVASDAEAYVSDDAIIFKNDTIKAYMPLLDMEYYNIDKVLEEETKLKVNVSKDDLLQKASMALLLGKKEGLLLQVSKGELVVSCRSQTGTMTSPVPADLEGSLEGLRITINPAYLCDALKSIPDERITLELAGKTKPLFIRGDGYCEVILPINNI